MVEFEKKNDTINKSTRLYDIFFAYGGWEKSKVKANGDQCLISQMNAEEIFHIHMFQITSCIGIQ